MPKSVMIVDANHLLHRVLHAGSFSSLKVQNSKYAVRRPNDDPPLEYGGAFGFLRTLRGALWRSDAVRCIAVWDGSLSERRLELYPEYKDRGLMNDHELEHRRLFRINRPIVRKLLPMLGVRSIRLPNREGDDVIYEVCRIAGELGHRDRVILSEDRDFSQLIGEGVRLHLPIKELELTRDNFEIEAGVPWSRYVMYRAIVGDKSDKITGVRGVGEKTALEVVLNAPSIKWRDLREFCAASKSARIRSIASSLKVVKRNYKLMRLGMEEFTDEELQYLHRKVETPPKGDLEAARALFNEYNFMSFTRYYTDWTIAFRRLGAR